MARRIQVNVRRVATVVRHNRTSRPDNRTSRPHNRPPRRAQQTPPPGGPGGNAANLPGAPLTLAAPADVAQISAMGFASTLFGRLDLFRQAYGIAPPVAYPVKARPYTKALPLAAVSPWSIYLQANGGVSDRQATAASEGFHLDSVGGTVGVEYRINPNAFIGAAFDYSNPEARLFNNAGTTEANSYQLVSTVAGRTGTSSRKGSRPSAFRTTATRGPAWAPPSPQVLMDRPSSSAARRDICSTSDQLSSVRSAVSLTPMHR